MSTVIEKAGRFDLAGKVVLITGAGGGFGSAIALEASACRAAVAVNDIDEATMGRTVDRIRERGGVAVGALADVTDAGAVSAMVQGVERALGPIDVLVNNAGITCIEPRGTFLTMDQWRNVLGVNLDGMWNCSITVLPGMMARRSGAIVSVSSTATSLLMIGSSVAYVASKGAIEFVTKALARRLAPHVRVNAVAPGSMQTPWYEKYYPDTSTWPKRYVPMDDVVSVALDLATNPSITGQVVTVDAAERFEVP